MQDPTILQVTKPLKWYNKHVRIDFKKLIIDLSKAIVMSLAGKKASAAKELISVAGVISFKGDPGGLAYLLILKSVLNAMYDLTTENIDLFPDDIQQLEKLHDDPKYVEFLDGLNGVLEEKKFGIKTEHLRHPKKMAIVSHFCEYLKKWLPKFGVSENDAEQLSYRLPDYFVLAFHEEWAKNSISYISIQEKLSSPAGEDVKHIFEWQHYYAFLKKQVQQSVFNESFSLEQIYIPLRGSYIKKVKEKKGEEEKEKKIKVAVHVEQKLNNWIKTERVGECMKVISGGPGSGKSSLAKMWAASLTENPALKVVFIPLHLFDLTSDFDSSLAQFFKESADIPLSYQEPTKELQEKTVFIFDGLDELAEQGIFSADMANRFIRFIQRINQLSNQDQRIRFLFLITGRELTIQGHQLDFRKEGQIITLLPYFIDIAEDNIGDWENIEVTKTDQRDQWWTQYGRLIKSGYEGLPTTLKEIDKLTEITAQPLLNYLVSLSIKREKLKITKDTTLNAIYNDLIEGVYERAYERPHIAVKELNKSEFFRIQEEIAIAAWHGGDVRTTTIRKIENHIKGSGLEPLLNRFKAGAEKGISRLLLAFFFKEHKGIEAGEKTFEFTHKSFGEYLTALRLTKLLKNLDIQIRKNDEDYDLGLNEEQALLKWQAIAGNTAIDWYILSFLRDEVSTQEKEEVIHWQETLSRLISFILVKGMPFRERLSHKEETRVSSNTGETLLAAVSCCTKFTSEKVRIELPNSRSFAMWISKLQNTSYGGIAFSCFENLDISGQDLNLVNLFTSNLKGAILEGTDLIYSILVSADLSGANLSGANLSGANLSGTNLSGTNLSGTNLSGTNLNRANLNGADLNGADLNGADLTNANLNGADLSRANLTEADLSGTNLNGADLTNANLNGANLQKLRDLTVPQLLEVKSLKNCKGLSRKIKAEVKKLKPELFK